ncbi:MAG: hypothetical protein LUE98_21590 [Tannerellaceae bacterium]|nr:hypothetical protein [Tannerellaceae bacterium]
MNRSDILERIKQNVERLTLAEAEEYKYIPLHTKPSPSVKAVRQIMCLLRKIIFPGFFGSEQEAQAGSIQYYTGVYVENLFDLLQEQIDNSLCFENENPCDIYEMSSGLAISFIDQLPELKRLLATDVKAMVDGDPAAKSHSEVIFCYPSIIACYISVQPIFFTRRNTCPATYYYRDSTFRDRDRHTSRCPYWRIF